MISSQEKHSSCQRCSTRRQLSIVRAANRHAQMASLHAPWRRFSSQWFARPACGFAPGTCHDRRAARRLAELSGLPSGEIEPHRPSQPFAPAKAMVETSWPGRPESPGSPWRQVQEPVKRGGRFSTKARAASLWSSVTVARVCCKASASRQTSNEAVSARLRFCFM